MALPPSDEMGDQAFFLSFSFLHCATTFRKVGIPLFRRGMAGVTAFSPKKKENKLIGDARRRRTRAAVLNSSDKRRRRRRGSHDHSLAVAFIRHIPPCPIPIHLFRPGASVGMQQRNSSALFLSFSHAPFRESQ